MEDERMKRLLIVAVCLVAVVGIVGVFWVMSQSGNSTMAKAEAQVSEPKPVELVPIVVPAQEFDGRVQNPTVEKTGTVVVNVKLW